MKVALWAEIRRLSEMEELSARAIAQKLQCSRRTVVAALALSQPPASKASRRTRLVDPYVDQIQALLVKHPQLSAVRIHEEISRGPNGFAGSTISLRRYLRTIRPTPGRVYQEVHYDPAQAMQIDWGECGRVQVGSTSRKVSVFVAVLCYSRMIYIEFTLSQRKGEFYRSLANAITFFGGSPRQVIFDNLKTAVLNGSGRHACLHPEFLALCGYFCLQPIACEVRDPESKGITEAGVRYVKRNALAGRSEELQRFEDYLELATYWRDNIANVRLHETTRERPIDRFSQERSLLRRLPEIPFDTDEIASAIVSPMARIEFEGNRYSMPPQFARKAVTIRANRDELRVLYEGHEVARHPRCYDRHQLILQPAHRLEALALRQRAQPDGLAQEFNAWGPAAREFHLQLRQRPVKTTLHLRRLVELALAYGRTEVLAALARTVELKTYDAAYVENLLMAERRRRQLPSPTLPTPQRRELIEEIELDPADPGFYDRFCQEPQEDIHDET